MIRVYNKQTNFIVIGDKHIAPFKSEDFEARNSVIRSLERSGIIKVTEIAPENVNPVTPDLFKYEVVKQEEKQQEVTEKQVEEIKEQEKKEAEEKSSTTGRSRRRRKTK